MSDTSMLILAFIIGAALAGVITAMIMQQKLFKQRQANSDLENNLAKMNDQERVRAEVAETDRDQFVHVLEQLSSDALKKSSDHFLSLANENFKRHQSEAEADLSKKEKAVEDLLKPIKESLNKTSDQIREIEKERHQAFGQLSSEIAKMTEGQHRLQAETRNLTQALRRPEVRGQWGELTLRRLAELAGMVDHCDFYEQETVDGENGQLRPDMIVRLPNKREIIVDVKTPLDAYLSAIEASNDAEQATHLQRHADNVRKRVNELAAKAYWDQFERSPEFVVLFIPGDQFLNAAFDLDARLLEDAMQKRVILATPTSLVALLRAVAFGWRQESVAENAEVIRKLGEDIYNRLSTFTGHLHGLGKSLKKSVETYNKTVGSLERNVLPGARRFGDLGISSSKSIPELEPVDTNVRNNEDDPITPELIDKSNDT